MFSMVVTYINMMNGARKQISFLFETIADARDRAEWYSTFKNVKYTMVMDLDTGEVISEYIDGTEQWDI